MASWQTRVFAASLVLMVQAGGAGAVWRVNERGECVREWTPASLARGPTAMLNAPLLPARSAAGGVLLARDDPTPNPGLPRRVVLPVALAVVGGGGGLAESLIWLGTGLVDTVTGGYFAVAPDEATELGVGPVTPAFSETRRTRGAESPCGAAH